MTARPLLAGAAIVRVVVYGAVVAYFGYMINKISASLSRIAATLEQMRMDKASQL